MPQIANVVGIDVSKNKLDWCIRGAAGSDGGETLLPAARHWQRNWSGGAFGWP